MMYTIEEVKNHVFEMSSKIGIKEYSNLLPMFSKTKEVFNEGASIYVDDKYHYIIMERGRIYKHYESEVLEDILYLMFKDMTFSLAQEFELKHRKKGQDCRKLLWKKQLKLLGKINKKFVDMRKREIEEVLKIAPYSK